LIAKIHMRTTLLVMKLCRDADNAPLEVALLAEIRHSRYALWLISFHVEAFADFGNALGNKGVEAGEVGYRVVER